jgi:DNA polymerase elongation subunit (family B)
MEPLSLWLWEIQVLAKLPQKVSLQKIEASNYNEEGIFILLFCKTKEGNTVTVIVDDWKPWCRLLSKDEKKDPLSILGTKNILELRRSVVYSIEKETPKQKLYGWEPNNELGSKTFSSVRLTLNSLYGLDRIESMVQTQTDDAGNLLATNLLLCDTLQRPKTRFLHDTGLCPCAWFTIEGMTANDFKPKDKQVTTSTSEVYAQVKHLKPNLANEEIPPIKVLSFDCEMSSYDGLFPSPYKGDTTFCISSALGLFTKEQPIRTVSIVIGQTNLESSTSHEIIHVSDFPSLMTAWRSLVHTFDPDIVTGWNTEGFDFEFMIKQYEEYFKAPHLRGTEQLLLAGLKANGIPSFSIQDVVKKMNFNQKQSILNSAKPNDKNSMRKFLFAGYDGSKQLVKEDEEDEDDEYQSLVLQDPNLYMNIRLQYNLSCEWKMNDTFRKDLLANFGNDAYTLLSTPKLAEKTGMYLSRIASECCRLETRVMNTAAKGDNVMQKVPMTGRVVMDMMRVIKDDQKPPSNALRWAAENWLSKDTYKIDLPTSELFRIWKEKDTEGLGKVVEYCARDAEIPLRLMFKLQYITSWIGLCRVCFLNPDSIINGGQQQRVFSLLTRRVLQTHAVNVEPSGWPQTPDYVGATVIDPDAGFFNKPISTLDFASLYPSIMGSNNLCFSTLVTNRSLLPTLVTAAGKKLYQDFSIDHPTPNGTITQKYAFVTHVQSVVSEALIALLAERKSVKKQMEATEDKFLKDILNKRQLALKVVCNSVYGFTGVDVEKGFLSCKPVAAVTTLIGRRLIGLTKKFVEEHFQGSRVVYGDTDSVMILWGVDTLEEAFHLGEKAAGQVTTYLRGVLTSEQTSLDIAVKDARDVSKMVSIVKLEHEKEYWPYLLLKKKNYAGRKWTPKSTNPLVLKDEIDMKGIQAVRRDTVPFIADLSKDILDCLLIDKSAEKALGLVKQSLKKVSLGEVDLEKYIISKSIASTYAHGETIPHVSAWLRMKQRGDEDPPPIGGRMPFVFIEGNSSVLAARAEHPEHVKKMKYKLDTSYYIQAAVKPITKLLQFFDDGTLKEVFEDALNVSKSRNTHNLMEFCGDDVLESSQNSNLSSPVNHSNKKRKVTKASSLEDFF